VKNRPLYVIDESINGCIKEKIDKKTENKNKLKGKKKTVQGEKKNED
jgi:hypothetical protein